MVKIKSSVRAVAQFLLPRYPYVNALTLLLLLAERANRETRPPFEAWWIYAYVGLLFLCGICMGVRPLRQTAAVIHAVQLMAAAGLVYSTDTLNYRYWVKLRMAHRMLGVAGFYVLFSYFLSPKPRRSKLLRMLGHALVGAYILAAAYTLLQSPEDKDTFLAFVPGGRPALFVYATLLATIGICYLPGQFVYDVTHALIVLVAASTMLIDVRMDYWTRRRGMDYWNQIRLMSDNVAIVIGALMYLTSTKKKELKEEKVD